MPRKDAERFIRDIAGDKEKRKSLYSYDTSEEIMNAVRDMGYDFKLFDFEESIRHFKLESHDEEQAIMLDEILLWWNILMGEQASCSTSMCSTCSSCG